MRLSGLGSLTMGMLLLNRSDALDEDATSCVTKALNTACGAWISGIGREHLAAKLRREGWETSDDAMFGKTGRWGEVAVTLRSREAKRICEIRMRCDETPWTTIPAATAAQAWIAAAFPGAVRERVSNMIINAELAHLSLWSDVGVKITLTAFETKQASPNADFILRVESV